MSHRTFDVSGRITIGMLSALLCVTPAWAQTQREVHRPDATKPRCGGEAEAQLVALINRSRTERRLSPLTVDARLTQTARQHTELMVRDSALSHQLPGEPPPQQRFENARLPFDREGENVALDMDVASAHEALMADPPHRRNILDPAYNVVGVAVICHGRQIFVTEDFARRLPPMPGQRQ